MNVWKKNSHRNILNNSDSDDFDIAISEWEFTGLVRDYKNCRVSCEMCENEKLRYQFIIKNELMNNDLKVGSSCILKFPGIRVFDRNGKVAAGRLRDNILDNALTELQKKMMLEPLRELWKRHYKSRVYIANQVRHYKKNNAFYPTAIVRLFKDFMRFGIDFDPSLYSVNLRKEECKRDILDMGAIDFSLVEQALSKAQIKKIESERAK